jgi:hypothetical protein
VNATSPRVVFLHSIWRARSTWLFSRFRASTAGFRCFYEPLNESLATLTRETVQGTPAQPRTDRRSEMRHPPLASGYWAEYADHLLDPGPGIKGYAPHFAFHPFDERNDPSPFFRRLIESASGSDVLLELCRSPFRIRWLVDRFPDAAHYYLERNPDDQYASYATRPGYFLPAHLAYARLQPVLGEALNRQFPELMPGVWGRLRLRDDFERWRNHFRRALATSPDQTGRAAFDFLWRAARDDAQEAGLRFVDMDDRDDIERAFEAYELSLEDYAPRALTEVARG